MTCPGCQIEYNSLHWGECPHCGAADGAVLSGSGSIPSMEGVIKTSTILISTDDGGVFESVEAVPEPLRATLVACTTGINAATIVIADQSGRARIAAALRTVPFPSSSSGLPNPLLSASHQSNVRFRGRVPVLLWTGALIAGFSGALVWLVISHLN